MLNAKSRDFIEKMGVAMERMGSPRTFGRIFGLLLVAEGPLSLEEMAELLHVSKASISTNIRQLEQAKYAERISYPGERRHYYAIMPGAIERSISARLGILGELSELAASGMAAIEKDNEIARRRLGETRDFYAFMRDEMPRLLQKWMEMQKGVNRE